MTPIPNMEPALSSRAMLCSVSISMWSARKYDPDASEEIAVRHGAQADSGRYHKILLPKEALAEIQKIVSETRQEHYFMTLPWDDNGYRVLPALFIVGRDRAKLGYFWRHAYQVPRSGRNRGCVVNPESGAPIMTDDGRLTVRDFEKVRIAEVVTELGEKSCRQRYAPLWEADNQKIPRVAPVDFISRYMEHIFDYAVCDELHQLAGDTAQGNALGALASCAERVVGLTGTLLGGYADDLYNILFRLQPQRMIGKGYEWGASGRSAFAQDYGVLETITKIEPVENACSDGKTTVTVRRKPGASPLLFGEFLMDTCAFVFLEDISDALPSYEESVVQVGMDAPMAAAYEQLEADMREALKAHRGNRSVLSIMLNALLLYPDHPYGLGKLYGFETDESGRRERFLIAETQDLPEQFAYAKERRLVEEVKKELAEGRRCQVFAVYTQKRDVTSRLERILRDEGISCAIMRSNIDTSKREAWYAKRLKEGVQLFIAHPKLVETGLDLLFAPTIIFYESGYSLHTLRQASRRSWRIGQRQKVRVKFLCYEGTMQAQCLRLMGKKLLVALAMEGKFAGEGLQTLDEDDDMLTSMAKELVEKNGIGESADAVWKRINTEHQRLFPTRTGIDGSVSESILPSVLGVEIREPSNGLIEAALSSPPVLVFGEKPKELRNVAVLVGLTMLKTSEFGRTEFWIESLLLLERSAKFVQVGVLIVFILFISHLGLTWKHYTAGIVAGFGISAGLQLAFFELRSLHAIGDNIFGLLNSAAYNCAVLAWAIYFIPQRMQAEAPKELPKNDLAQWDQLLRRYLNR